MPKISVIMGVYNCKNNELLKKSIDSILSQTFKDFEFIICNDGSTDDTLVRLKQIETMDSRIRIISYDKNQGLNHALNTCLEVAKGEYIARQDDDDLSKPERLRIQMGFLNEHPEYAMVGTCADIFDDDGVWGEYLVPERPLNDDFFMEQSFYASYNVVSKKCRIIWGGVQGSKGNKKMRRL